MTDTPIADLDRQELGLLLRGFQVPRMLRLIADLGVADKIQSLRTIGRLSDERDVLRYLAIERQSSLPISLRRESTNSENEASSRGPYARTACSWIHAARRRRKFEVADVAPADKLNTTWEISPSLAGSLLTRGDSKGRDRCDAALPS